VQQHTHEQNIEKLNELIADVQVAMLTTVEADGTLHSRPMATQKTKFDGTLWFFTAVDSAKVYEIERERHVNVSYSRPDKQHYVAISGTARLVLDRKKVEELWTPFHLAWFPQGVDDPTLALLRVDVESAEYWDSPSSKAIQLFGLAKALLTGKRYGEEGTDHEKVKL
jgi:general stress protein 26